MEKRREFIINTLYIAIICGLIYLVVNYILGIIAPFILGFIFAYFAIKIARNVLKNDSKLYRILALIGLYIAVIIIISLIVSLGLTRIIEFVRNLPSFYSNTMEPYITSLEVTLQNMNNSLPKAIADSLGNITDSFFDALKTILSSSASGLVNITKNVITNAPDVLISVIVMIVTSVYFVVDYEELGEWFTSVVPAKNLETFYEIKDFIENTLLKIVGAYLVIMGITFVELVIGLSILGVSNSVMWSLLIALMDILPVLGVGTALIPWALSSLITGKYALGIGLLVLYIIISIVRNIVEPKFVGTSLNLHPLATLASMIVGLRLFGAIGMFGFPLTLSFFVSRSKYNKEEKNTKKRK